MAFHVACPITCRRICDCALGFPRTLATGNAKASFLEDVLRVHDFLIDPSGIRARDHGRTVQVAVPKVAPPPPPLPQPVMSSVVEDGYAAAVVDDESAAAASSQAKRAALQRKAAADMVAAEDFARRFESGYLSDTSRGVVGEEQSQSNVNVMCRICFCGENEGSERARKMLPCKTCGKKYHRNCVKVWSKHRDLFHWSSWTCPLCRICEVCRRTGDPNKLMFCKRCDGAYHCYCQHPSHKNVSPGPYVCPKHTQCRSCGSKVPGNGLSVRWFLGYTCCDACGRLFVKGNYCPVCLKVYRDSESTPMVCCDLCQRWVHCHCDGISDERYQLYQLDGNLEYKCATCRGECYQVKNNEDAVVELWRRKDEAEQDLIFSLRVAAGLPTQEEIFSISPYSDDEENGPQLLKNEYGRPLKLSLKGLVDKSQKRTNSGKKSSTKVSAKKKEYQEFFVGKTEVIQRSGGHDDPQSFGSSLGYDKNDEMLPYKNAELDLYSLPIAGSISHTEEICSVNEPGILKHKFVDEVMASDEDRASKVVRIKGKPHGLDSGEDTGKHAGKSKPVKGKKLVINFGARKINLSNSPTSDASTCQREQDLLTSSVGEDASQQRAPVMVDRHDGSVNAKDRSDYSSPLKVPRSAREGNFIKLGKVRSGASDHNPKFARGDKADEYEAVQPEQTPVSFGKGIEGGTTAAVPVGEVPTLRNDRVYSRKHSHSRSNIRTETNDSYAQTPVSHSSSKDAKPPSLKFKLRKPNIENQNSSHHEEEKSYVKGQRSKRKRPSLFMEKTSFGENDDKTQSVQDNVMDEMDVNWILKKLGRDAIGKRVEVQQLSDNSWHKGVVSDVIEGMSTLSVTLDDGKVKSLELGKQGVRFVSQKHKRPRT